MCLLILIGKSGSDKVAIQNALVKQKSFDRTVTSTTRPVRKREQNGVSDLLMMNKNLIFLKQRFGILLCEKQ